MSVRLLTTRIVTCVAIGGPCVTARAEIKTWDGGAGTLSWQDAANWNPDGLPGKDDHVVIGELNGDVAVTHSAGTSSIMSMSVAGRLIIASGTVSISHPSTVEGELTLNGSLGGAGDLTIDGTMTWTSPQNTSISGGGKLIIAPMGVLNKTGRASQRRAIENYGTCYATSAWWLSATTFNNHGEMTWDIQSGFSEIRVGTAPVEFNNFGSMTKLGSGSLWSQASPNGFVEFRNSGVLSIEEGDVHIGRGSHSGRFEINNPESTLELGRATIYLGVTSRVTGVGTLIVDTFGLANSAFLCDGTIDLDGNMEVRRGTPEFSNLVRVRGELRFAPDSDTLNVSFNGGWDLLPTGSISGKGTVHVHGPSVDLAGRLDRDMAIHFDAAPHVSRVCEWRGATVHCSDPIVVESDGTFRADEIYGDLVLRASIENHGVFEIGEHDFRLASGVSIVNYGDLIARKTGVGDSTVSIRGEANATPPPMIVNEGVFAISLLGRLALGRDSPGAGPLTLANGGTLRIDEGFLECHDDFTNAGETLVAEPATLRLSGATFHDPSSLLRVNGSIEFDLDPDAIHTHDMLGHVEVAGHLSMRGGLLILHNAIQPAYAIVLNYRSGIRLEADQEWPAGIEISAFQNVTTISGPGNLVLGGTSMLNGRMGGPGSITLTADANGTTSGGATPQFACSVINHGTLNIQQSVDFAGGVLTNFGVVLIDALQPLIIRGLAGENAFENRGQLIKHGPGSASFSNFGSPISLANHGSATIIEGVVKLDCGAKGEGSVHIASAGTLRVNSNCHAGSVHNDGLLWLSPQKRLELSGQFNQGATGRFKTTVIAGVQPIVVSGDAIQLNGVLDVRMTPLPSAAASAPLLQSINGAIQGYFVSSALRPQGQLVYEPSLVRWIAFVQGDADGNNVVNIDDLLLLIQMWGACPFPPASCTCDMNSDGVVDTLDLMILTENWP